MPVSRGNLATLAAMGGGEPARDWRREWDSNPRYGCPYTRFPSVRLQPLGHPSVPEEPSADRWSGNIDAGLLNASGLERREVWTREAVLRLVGKSHFWPGCNG